MHADVEANLVSQALPFPLPQPHARAVAPATVGRDGETACVRIPGLADLMPPPADRLHGERRRVVVNADADPAGVLPAGAATVLLRRRLPRYRPTCERRSAASSW